MTEPGTAVVRVSNHVLEHIRSQARGHESDNAALCRLLGVAPPAPQGWRKGRPRKKRNPNMK